ncbi:hypothetical protein STENM327S_05107 [Streptomyces tendae]
MEGPHQPVHTGRTWRRRGVRRVRRHGRHWSGTMRPGRGEPTPQLAGFVRRRGRPALPVRRPRGDARASSRFPDRVSERSSIRVPDRGHAVGRQGRRVRPPGRELVPFALAQLLDAEQRPDHLGRRVLPASGSPAPAVRWTSDEEQAPATPPEGVRLTELQPGSLGAGVAQPGTCSGASVNSAEASGRCRPSGGALAAAAAAKGVEGTDVVEASPPTSPSSTSKAGGGRAPAPGISSTANPYGSSRSPRSP